jgi:exodeoxyribonuclease V beta subunit
MTDQFDLTGPLPTGVTVLEASAGTGKTYTIAGLAARYVCEGIPLEQLLLVTFTRMATGELRERVRERLVSAERFLAGAGRSDPVNELLATGTPEQLAVRRDRLARALADFDAATISTTHGFCQEALGGLGIAGDLEPDTAFVEDIGDLVEEVVDDLYVRKFHGHDGKPPFERSQAGQIARAAIGNPDAPIAPAVGEVPEMRRALAEVVRKELELRKRRLAVMTFDDLLTRLDDALADDAVAARLRARYRVVLVDEFQDTDPVQWSIVRRAFAVEGVTLVLIGDPKQAIYAFRGADVYAYLDAARSAAARPTLEVNWRSDQPLIDAYDALFGGLKLGHLDIAYRHVRAADEHRVSRLSDAPHGEPLRIRVVHRDESSVELTGYGYATAPSARKHIAKDVAADLVALLSARARVDGEAVRPRHIAVLVPTNRTAALIRDALDEADIPAVINGAGSVFGTGPARDWLRLLEAIERPASLGRARAAALTSFLGWSAERVASADEDAWEDVHGRLHDWARVLRVRGVASLMETITLTERLPERVLREDDGERRLTDLRHVGQLLHAAASAEHMGTAALTVWLRRRIAEAQDDTSNEERSRRLDSDAEAVQVLTVHRSKGLEFPIVYAPFLWEPGYIPGKGGPVFFHDPDADDARTIDVGLQGGAYSAHYQQSTIEQRGEDLRLAYVALTRARHQAVVWWAGSQASRHSPLGRMLFSADDEGNVRPWGDGTPTDAAAVARFDALAAQAPRCISVERSRLGLPVSWAGPLASPERLAAAVFDRGLDWHWRRTSFSDITAGAYEARVASEPEEEAIVVEDEPAVRTPRPAPAVAPDAGPLAIPSPLAAMPAGVAVGTFVHRVFEATDFAAVDLGAELGEQVAAAQAWRSVDIGDTAVAIAGLRAAIETPLGPVLRGASLRSVARADRLDELEFELPLAGGDSPTSSFSLGAIGDVLRDHLPADDPLAGYGDRLDDPALRRDVRGYLTGFLDLVIRVPGDDGEPRFAVLDYKTNWLGAPGEDLLAWHYRPEALATEMQRDHYGLQALFYTVALHRYLRWRLPGYDPERNLAGVVYAFVRGMTGLDTPVVDGMRCGVFSWQPPAPLVEALSDALDLRGRSL